MCDASHILLLTDQQEAHLCIQFQGTSLVACLIGEPLFYKITLPYQQEVHLYIQFKGLPFDPLSNRRVTLLCIHLKYIADPSRRSQTIHHSKGLHFIEMSDRRVTLNLFNNISLLYHQSYSNYSF